MDDGLTRGAKPQNQPRQTSKLPKFQLADPIILPQNDFLVQIQFLNDMNE